MPDNKGQVLPTSRMAVWVVLLGCIREGTHVRADITRYSEPPFYAQLLFESAVPEVLMIAIRKTFPKEQPRVPSDMLLFDLRLPDDLG